MDKADALGRINVAYLSISELEQAIPDFSNHLPEDIREQSASLSEKRKREFLAGRWLLLTLLQHFHAVETLPKIMIGQNGKPVFKDLSLPYFSISHSGDFVMVVIAQDGEVGLDLEVIRTRANCLALAKHYFSETEHRFLTEQSPEEQLLWFWRLWTVRESILKLKALTVWQMKELTLDPQSFYIETALFNAAQTVSYSEQTFCWAVTVETPCTIDQHKVSLFSLVPVFSSVNNKQTMLWQQKTE